MFHGSEPTVHTSQNLPEEQSPRDDLNLYAKNSVVGSAPTSAPSKTKIAEWVKEVEQWAKSALAGSYEVSAISWLEATEVQQEVAKRGLKLRIFGDMRTQLLGTQPRCLTQEDVVAMGDTAIHLETRFVQPDEAFGVKTRHGSNEGDITTLHPRVVFESAVSQSETSAREKGELYLTETRVELQVHAVVILNFKNAPTRLPNGTISDDKTCRVTLEVWVRTETNDLDFPLDDCPQVTTPSGGTDEASPELGSDEDLAPSHLSDTYRSLETSFSSTATTSTNWSLGNRKQVKRRGEVIVLLDESQPVQAELPNLVFDVYDFFRICGSDPETTVDPDQRLIDVPLEQLRDIIRGTLSHERYRLQQLCTIEEDTPPAVGPATSAQNRPTKRKFVPPRFGDLLASKRSKNENPVGQ
ncbi:hypothetical protein FRC07_004538 [Ceratobasidium sp. 392]|nr:hypothetical protein FRC07_004538 [Ceratobasidium sp. 392]